MFFILFNLISFFKLASKQSYSEKMNPNGIFPNNELNLEQIKVYGFDFGLLFYLLKERKKTNLFSVI